MTRTRACLLVSLLLLLLLLPTHLLAGGPPRLCLPVDGVTADNADDCVRRLAEALGDKLFRGGTFPGLTIRWHEDQAYAILMLRGDLLRSEVEAALRGSPYSLCRQTLPFGVVILEIDTRDADGEQLARDLQELDYVSVAATAPDQPTLLVTVASPRLTRDVFRELDANESYQDPFLASYFAAARMLSRHQLSVRDVRWSTTWGCRMFGCLRKPADTGYHDSFNRKPTARACGQQGLVPAMPRSLRNLWLPRFV